MFNEFFGSSVEHLGITSDFSSILNPNNIDDILIQYEIYPSCKTKNVSDKF